MYVCMYVCMHACMQVCTYVRSLTENLSSVGVHQKLACDASAPQKAKNLKYTNPRTFSNITWAGRASFQVLRSQGEHQLARPTGYHQNSWAAPEKVITHRQVKLGRAAR